MGMWQLSFKGMVEVIEYFLPQSSSIKIFFDRLKYFFQIDIKFAIFFECDEEVCKERCLSR